MDLKTLEKRIIKIEQRNSKVEADKTWETSLLRKIIIFLITYIIIGLFMSSVNIKDSWLNALIPSLGFLLSTLTLSLIKSWWIKYIHKN